MHAHDSLFHVYDLKTHCKHSSSSSASSSPSSPSSSPSSSTFSSSMPESLSSDSVRGGVRIRVQYLVDDNLRLAGPVSLGSGPGARQRGSHGRACAQVAVVVAVPRSGRAHHQPQGRAPPRQREEQQHQAPHFSQERRRGRHHAVDHFLAMKGQSPLDLSLDLSARQERTACAARTEIGGEGPRAAKS